MRLRDLNAKFMTFQRQAVDPNIFVDGVKSPSGWRDIYHNHGDRLEGAHGIWFDCPKSRHGVLIWFAGSPVPDDVGKDSEGRTVRWTASGTNLDDLTLTPSIWEKNSECGWHGFVSRGDAA